MPLAVFEFSSTNGASIISEPDAVIADSETPSRLWDGSAAWVPEISDAARMPTGTRKERFFIGR